MNNNTRTELKARFERAMNLLRSLGFQGECLVTADTVTIHAADKASAAMIRKAFKQVRAAGVMTETRNKQTGGAIFLYLEAPAAAPRKAYHQFKDVHGNAYGFPDYMSFATWYFSVPRRIAVLRFDAETFRRLNYEACNSREARQPAEAVA